MTNKKNVVNERVTYRSGANLTMACKGQLNECWVSTQPIKNVVSKGFTLIELLVVVLIIGILAAVAVPQYQKAVEKSRAVQALTLLKTMYMAAEGFYMGNGVWPDNLNDLDLGISWEGNTKWNHAISTKAISNQDWSLQLEEDSSWNEVTVGRISGPYKGGGFVMFQKYYSDDMPLRTPVCAELKGSQARGKYCRQIFGGEFFRETDGFLYYSLP